MSGDSLDRLRFLLRKGAHGLGLEGDFAKKAPPGMPDGAGGAKSVREREAFKFDGGWCYAEHHLAVREGKSDKVYFVRIVYRSASTGYATRSHDAYNVEVMYGRRIGHKTKAMKGSHHTYDGARYEANALVEEKVSKGYRIVSSWIKGLGDRAPS